MDAFADGQIYSDPHEYVRARSSYTAQFEKNEG